MAGENSRRSHKQAPDQVFHKAITCNAALLPWIVPPALVRRQLNNLALALKPCGFRTEIVETCLFPKERDCHSRRAAQVHVERTQ